MPFYRTIFMIETPIRWFIHRFGMCVYILNWAVTTHNILFFILVGRYLFVGRYIYNCLSINWRCTFFSSFFSFDQTIYVFGCNTSVLFQAWSAWDFAMALKRNMRAFLTAPFWRRRKKRHTKKKKSNNKLQTQNAFFFFARCVVLNNYFVNIDER